MTEQPTGTVTLLFSDIEGSTRLLEQLGRARYADALATHCEILRGALNAHDGYEVDYEGDAFFFAFRSAAEAVAAAVDAQRKLASHGWPDGHAVRVRMGLHTGEPLLQAPKYVGLDVHRAARIMATGHGGQVLLSERTAGLVEEDLADDVRLIDLGDHQLKDLSRSQRLFQLQAMDLPAEFPPLRTNGNLTLPRSRRSIRQRSTLAMLGVACVVGIALVAVAISGRGGGEDPLQADSLAAIDPRTNHLTWHVSVGQEGPTQIAVSGEKVWTLNRNQTVSVVNGRTQSLAKTFAVGATPTDIAAGASGLWMGVGTSSSVLKLNPDNGAVVKTIKAPPFSSPPLPAEEFGPLLDAGSVAVSEHAVWFLSGNATLSRIDPETHLVSARIRPRAEPGQSLTYAAVGAGGVWVYAYNGGSGDLTRVDPNKNSVVWSGSIQGTGPLAVGEGNVWVLDNPKHLVWQIDPGSATTSRPPAVVRSITVGQNPVDIAVGFGSVWVASVEGTVSRIDPVSATVIDKIQLGRSLGGIAAGDGFVWVTVQ
jgi:class 3 adenylate cyclase